MIDEKKLIEHIEKQYREWGEEYDAMQILGDIEDFPKVDGWIPVEERLPDFGEIVIEKITAWMPLPEPYVKGDVEQ